MINATTIAQMKMGVVIINTSRGALIDTETLVEGIKVNIPRSVEPGVRRMRATIPF